MRSPYFYGVGGVLSADIAVPEHARELDFYVKVLTTGKTPLWRDDLTNNQGNPVIGLGERLPEYEALPLQWMPHIQVADVAASAAQAVEMGGQELMHGKGDDGQSQWAVLVDPAGAAFGIIPVVHETNGARPQGEIGCISWLSLVVSDATSMCSYYEQVVGWSAAPEDIDGKRNLRTPNGSTAAEICPVNNANRGVPSVWLLHLPVGDLEESLLQVHKLGGEVIGERKDANHAIIRDPVGICFALQAHN
jgi:predicted enzyme related to lactoylglutathione lyase